MNVLNRIKRLETKLVIASRFCECFHEHRRKMIDLVYNGTPYTEKDVRLPAGDYCQKCRKPVDVEFEERTERNLQLIYGQYENL